MLKLISCLVRVSIFPGDTDAVLGVSDAQYGLGNVKEVLDKLLSDGESARIIEERRLLKPFKLLELQKLPEGTLGRVYADHMIGHNLNPDFFKTVRIVDSQTFCMMRIRQSHDLWHLITGFDTSVVGELGLQSFYYAQTNTTLAPFMVGLGIIGASFKDRKTLVPIFEVVVKGWLMAKKARPLFPVDWEANWSTPLEDLRKDLLRN